MSGIWWERRRVGEASHSYLVRVLRELGAEEIAEEAELNWSDMLVPTLVPAVRNTLVRNLRWWSVIESLNGGGTFDRTTAVISAIKSDEFTPTVAEQRNWTASDEGQAYLDELDQMYAEELSRGKDR